MAPLPPPPELTDELVEEVLIRIPPEDPAGLVRSALVCKPWYRVAYDPGFRRRIRELHRAVPAPVLGVLCNPFDDAGDVPFVPTSSFRPPRVRGHHRGWRALDARHGRVLFCNQAWEEGPVPDALVVWDPVTGEVTELPELPRHEEPFEWSYWNAAVLCAAAARGAGACDHLDCHSGPFLVAIAGTTIEGAFAHVYSSEAADWMSPISCAHRIKLDFLAPSVLVGDALYFKCETSTGTGILQYTLSTRKLSVIYAPVWHGYAQPTVLMTTEDNGDLGFATVYHNKLYLWAMEREAASDGDAGWAQSRVIELNTLLPANALLTSPTAVGYADGIGVLFLATGNGLFSIELKSGQVKKVRYGSGIHSVVPYMSFCTPALGDGASSEKPIAKASSEKPVAKEHFAQGNLPHLEQPLEAIDPQLVHEALRLLFQLLNQRGDF